jgi:hypothetical protein
MFHCNLRAANQVASRQENNALTQPKAAPVYTTPQLVVLGQARDLVQGGFPPGACDFNRGYVRR